MDGLSRLKLQHFNLTEVHLGSKHDTDAQGKNAVLPFHLRDQDIVFREPSRDTGRIDFDNLNVFMGVEQCTVVGLSLIHI